jgi:hypothetical protein
VVDARQPDCPVNGQVGNTLSDNAEASNVACPAELVDAGSKMPATSNGTWSYEREEQF